MLAFLNKIKENFNKIINHLCSKQEPLVKENTFILWEPCSKSHSEVIPGYAKYLLDLGYHVSVCVEPQHIKSGLFSRFEQNDNLTLNEITSKQMLKFFKNADLSKLKGIMVTTVGKLCDCIHYNQVYNVFNNSMDKSKLYFVEHKAKEAIDNGSWNEKLITLRKLDYKGADSVVVNPHYFGEKIKETQKNEDIINFVTIGALRDGKKDTSIIIDAVSKLHDKGIFNFKVTVIGKGHLKNVPKHIRNYFDIKGKLGFANMYEEIEKADYILTSYDNNNQEHLRYTKYQTSGNFQLIYGFLKPCLLIESFAEINKYNNKNSILYKSISDYADAMEQAINLSKEDYTNMQRALRDTVKDLYKESLENLKGLING